MTTSSTTPAQLQHGDSSMLAWLRLVRVFQKVHTLTSRELRCASLTRAHFDVLMRIGAAEGISQQELADALLVTKGNVCQVIGRMEEAGLVLRVAHGRVNRLYLTDHGRQAFAEVRPAHARRVYDAFGALSDDERQQLLGLLRKVDRSLGREIVDGADKSVAPSN